MLNRLSRSQRVVIVIGLGLALLVIGAYLTSLGVRPGWYAYAPLARAASRPLPQGLHHSVRLLIWIALTATWVAAAAFITSRPRPAQRAIPGR